MYTLKNQSGLKVQVSKNLSIHSMFHKNLFLNLYLGNDLEVGPNNLILQYETQSNKESLPLFSPFGSPEVKVSERQIQIKRKLDNLDLTTKLELHPKENCWRIQTTVKNKSIEKVSVCFIRTQDVGLCDYFSARLNEAFVSHYIHHEIIKEEPYGISILSRQNESVRGKNPTLYQYADIPVVSYATDGTDIFKDGKIQTLANRGKQGEHSMVALGTNVCELEPNETKVFHFYSYFIEDLDRITSFSPNNHFIHLCQFGWEDETLLKGSPVAISLFHKQNALNGEMITKDRIKKEFPGVWRNVEENPEGTLLSFFTEEETHVTLVSKERCCLRPQGQILRTGTHLIPRESSLTITSYFQGIFLSQLTEGHASSNQLLSRKSGDLGFSKSKGLRIFCKISGAWKLLEHPSYLISQPKAIEWVYVGKSQTIKVKVVANDNDSVSLTLLHDLNKPMEVLFSFSTGLDGENGDLPLPPQINLNDSCIIVAPNRKSSLYERLLGAGFRIETQSLQKFQVTNDDPLWVKGNSMDLPYLTLQTKLESRMSFTIFGELEVDLKSPLPSQSNIKKSIVYPSLLDASQSITNSSLLEMFEILPWYKQNAEIHYLNPRGLEQFSGGGWGTRDVCQGAFEFLLFDGNFSAIRDLLLRVFSEQNEDGDWPQWFMLYDRDKNIRASDSHGDILYWPLLSLITYLERSNDFSILEEVTTNQKRKTNRNLLESLEVTVSEIHTRMIPNTNLPKYGHGDWNDSMQPKDESLHAHAVSSWTAELQTILFQKLVWLYSQLGDQTKANQCSFLLQTMMEELQNKCMESGVIAGLITFTPNQKTEFLLHPNDHHSTISYSILPMIYGILSNVFSMKEAEFHLDLIKKHLTGPDGVRLFDKPVPYKQGNTKFFRRAETASYFGREIGLMYTHAHLRYCEALAHMGKSDEFFGQLNLTNPIGITKRIPACQTRQSNCYYSSSDGAFLDRMEAESLYAKLIAGEIPLEGGWRVYSSGPGIFLKLFYESLLGIQINHNGIVFDPIFPKEFDGLCLDLELFSQKVKLIYHIRSKRGTIETICMNGNEIFCERRENKYRRGGLKLTKDSFSPLQKQDITTMEIYIQ